MKGSCSKRWSHPYLNLTTTAACRLFSQFNVNFSSNMGWLTESVENICLFTVSLLGWWVNSLNLFSVSVFLYCVCPLCYCKCLCSSSFLPGVSIKRREGEGRKGGEMRVKPLFNRGENFQAEPDNVEERWIFTSEIWISCPLLSLSLCWGSSISSLKFMR